MRSSRIILCVVLLAWAAAAQAVNVELVTVGNPGNEADTRYNAIAVGDVAYSYQIGKFEVTAGQYCEFLNSVARTDTYWLYSLYMASPNAYQGCNIQRSGSWGTYTYSVAPDWADRPVNYVSWGDAVRFANWLHNGQPSGTQNPSTTEDGSYYLNGANSNAQLLAVTRKANATWVVPSEDEWYKAAYHKNDGVTGNYWDYPTGTNSVPSNVLANPDPGNNANYDSNGPASGGYTIGSPYYMTLVGEFENSESPYGTFDQGGNVWEWNEAVVSRWYRGLRGGCFAGIDDNLRAVNQRGNNPWSEDSYRGFRVAEIPEPGSMVMLVLASVGLLRRKWV